MEFVITEYAHCDLITISGRVDSYTSPKIQVALNALITDDRTNIVVNLQDVSYLSSSGMLVLVNAQKTCKRQNRGEVVLTNVPDNVYSNFELSGFHQMFTFFDDVTSAVGRF